MTPIDPFDRIQVPPVDVPKGLSVIGEEPAAFSPAYAQEQQGGGGSSGGGDQGSDVIRDIIASGGVFTEKTGCNSGAPYTYWAPEWTSNPTP